MTELDHITVIAPSLAEGAAHLREALGLDVPFGRRHADMGTYNLRLRLGPSRYMEVIAVDPDAPAPQRPRWFGLSDQAGLRRAWDEGRRLRGFVARTSDIAAAAGFAHTLGPAVELNPSAPFLFTLRDDGALPLSGAAPILIDRHGKPPAMADIPDLGATLMRLVLEHPDPDRIAALYRDLRLADPPALVAGPAMRYRAEIETPSGLKHLA